MKKIYLHGAIGKRFGREWSFSAKKIPEILWALEANCDGFFEYSLSRKQKGLDYIFSTVTPTKIKSKSDLVQEKDFELNYLNEELHIIPLTQGGGLITALSTFFIAAGGGLTLHGMIVLSLAISFAMQALMKPPEPPKRGKPTTTKSYLIAGGRNIESQGVPVPIGYGRLMVGSMVINIKEQAYFLDKGGSDASLQSFNNIEYIDLISEGPVEGFVNQNGGAIHEGDIQEGIFLNGTAIKNIKTSSDESDVFNYILNENEEVPQFKKGVDDESILLSEEVSLLTKKEELLMGARPYAQDPAVHRYDDRSSAIASGAKPFSYTVSRKSVNRIIINFRSELSVNITEGSNAGGNNPNSCRFGIYKKSKNKNYSIFDPDLGIKKIRFFDPAIKQFKEYDLEDSYYEYSRIIGDIEKSDYEVVRTIIEKIKGSSVKRNTRTRGPVLVTPLNDRRGFGRNTPTIKEILSEQEYSIYEKYQHIIVRGNGKNSTLNEDVSEEQLIYDRFYKRLEEDSKAARKLSIFEKDSERRFLYVDPIYQFFIIHGIATAAYSFDIEIEYDPSVNESDVFSIVKLDSEYDSSVKGGETGGSTKTKNLQIYSVQERISLPMVYPHAAACRMVFDGKNFKSTPERNYHLKLKKVLLPSNYDPISRKYNGPWDGLFYGQKNSHESLNSIPDKYKFWTDNPGWIFFDLVQNPRYGLGKYGLEESNIDKWQLYKAAKYCDELVDTNFPIETITGSLRSFKTFNNIQDSNDSDNGCFVIKLYNDSWYYDVDQAENQLLDYSEAEFIEEFGDKKSYAGKKIAIFIYQHELGSGIKTSQQIDLLKKNSSLKKGKYIIEERIIKETNAKSKTITLFGPSLKDNPAVFVENNKYTIIGGCAAETNYPLVEPRFTCNAYLNERSDALSTINNLASTFRGLIGYNFGKIFTMQDSKKNPIMLFNNSNIRKDTGFRYAGFEKNKKFTSALIRFNNKNKDFGPDFVYEEDPDAMRLYGHQQKELMAFGTTSESQARRLAKWLLYTSQFETEKITFITGEEGAYLYPSSVIEISDENRTNKSMSGRILNIVDQKIFIDKSIKDIISSGKVEFCVNVGLPFTQEELLDSRASFHKSIDDQDVEIESYVAPQLYKFSALLDTSSEYTGPQGQNTVVYDLMLKTVFELELASNLFKSFNHGLEDGDRVSFDSLGTLPSGLNKNRVEASSYYVIKATEHTFKVSLSLDGSEVFIFDEGKDRLGNEGGLHYVCIQNISENLRAKNKKAIDQIEIGASYSLQGVYAVEPTDIADESGQDLTNLFVIESEGSDWYYSSMFGSIILKGDYVMSPILGWIYILHMNFTRSSTGEFFWFYMIGKWFATNEDLYNKYWFMSDGGQDISEDSTQGKWVYVYYGIDSDGFSQPTGKLYIYDNNHSYSRGDRVVMGEKEFKVISAFSNHAPEENKNGYLILPSNIIENNDIIQSAPDAVSSEITQQEKESNPNYKSEVVLNISAANYSESMQNNDAIRIQLTSGHGLDFDSNNTIYLKNFSSNSNELNDSANKQWQVIKVSDNEIELIDSAAFARELSTVIINDKGIIEYIESLSTISMRSFQSQLFRVLSVKEISDREYEVSGMEYNLSKFDSIDRDKTLTFPSVPIPPQADMDIPEAPENLILTDLTD